MMVVFRWRNSNNILKQITSIISFLLFHWHQRIHLYIYFCTLSIACFISYYQSSGLLFTLRRVDFRDDSINFVRDKLIKQQKQEQKEAYQWLENLSKNPQNYPYLISNQTFQSQFYNYLQFSNNHPSSLYTLLNKPKQTSISNTTDHIVISILYSKQNSDYQQGKFYLGQVLHHLLENYHLRFLITLCESNNTDEEISDGIRLIRQLLPVFIVNPKSNSDINPYEREKQSHLQCIQANFLSFPNINYLLLLQDDAKPISKHFYSQLSSLIDNRIEKQWPLDGHRQHPAFIKLYHPKWLIGYLHPSVYVIMQLIATSFLLTCSILFLFQWLISQKRRSISSQYYFRLPLIKSKSVTNLIYFSFYYILILLVLFLLDHCNISWTWRSLHPAFYALYPAPSCCLPGVLFFRQTYPHIIDYLESIDCHRKYAIDTAFDDLPRRTGLQTYLIEPNLLHHIGLYSRLRKAYINPYLLD